MQRRFGEIRVWNLDVEHGAVVRIILQRCIRWLCADNGRIYEQCWGFVSRNEIVATVGRRIYLSKINEESTIALRLPQSVILVRPVLDGCGERRRTRPQVKIITLPSTSGVVSHIKPLPEFNKTCRRPPHCAQCR